VSTKRYLLLILLALGGTVVGVWQWKVHRRLVGIPEVIHLPVYGNSAYDTRAPDGVRIKVEVLNATKKHGLARRATQYLRDRGFDVVLIGTVREQRQETLVLDRSNHPEWAHLLAKAMSGQIQERPDTSLYVDATVLIGGNWTPPALPFYP
jgi:hypothetical protein